jgi:hypothetical protein
MAVFAAGLLLLSFATPARTLWARTDLGWWAPFLIWSLAIAALMAAARRSDDDGRNRP